MPKDINDSYLGTIKYNWYEGTITNVDGKNVEFSFEIDENLEVLKGVREIISNVCQQKSKFKSYAADELLDLYNDTWCEDEEIEKDKFISLITLESISISSDLRAEFYYLDGEPFGGHWIVISTNSKYQFEDAYIAG